MEKEYTYKRITKKDEKPVYDLVNIVYLLERKDFLIPWTKEQMDRFFDEEYSYLYGAYDILNIERSKTICEVGGFFLVFVPYRNQGIMSKLAKIQYDLAVGLDYDYIIASAHPDNVESNKILKKLV